MVARSDGGSAYRDLARAKLKAIMASPTLFAMRSAGDVVLVSLETVAPLVLVYRFGSIAGWSGAEVAMLMALGRAGEGLALVFGRGVDPTVFGETIRLGRFDQVLTRPVSPLAWLLTTDIELRFIFRTIAGVVIAASAAHRAGVALGPANLAIMSAAVVSSAVLVLSILVIGASITFRTSRGRRWRTWSPTAGSGS